MRSLPPTADQRIRDLGKEFKGLEAEDPGPDRAARLASFTRAWHAERQLNMAMHAAALCLAEDPSPPALLIEAYDGVDDDPEDRLRTLGDLRDLGRYLDRQDLVAHADGRMLAEAREWVAAGDEAERRHRLRTVQSAVNRETADRIRDELRAS